MQQKFSCRGHFKVKHLYLLADTHPNYKEKRNRENDFRKTNEDPPTDNFDFEVPSD